ncbi:MAG: dockerin type I repeat-containing protein, partial [Prevotella sp.]|nr:dockerin type I repeat-containing protein [Prevotella sp.]
WGCRGLTSVKVESETPLSIYYNTFYLAQANATLYVPKGSKAAYEAADYWREFKEIVEMPNQSVQFVDEAGNMKEDGSTITITEGEDDGWGGMMFPSGLYVQNTSDEDIYVGIDYDIKELPNGSFQLCFPQNCVNKTKTGASKTEVGLLQADAKRSIMAEWLPDVLGFGTCIVDFKVNTYTYNSSTKQYELQTEGPTVTAKMVYSDGGDTPQPSTNILSAYVPTLLLGKQATMRMNLANEDELIACEFDLQLPNGITIAKNEDGDPIATLSSRASKHSLAVSDKGNGLYHFLCYSNSNVAFSGNEGELLTIELLCDGNVAVGTYQATVKNIIFSDVDKNKITPADITFDLEVIDAVPGDVNNDGEINVMDVVEMVAYIMGDGAEGFVFAAADLYQDGAINVMDLVNLVDLIMNSSVSNAREWTENSMSLSTLADGAVSVKVNNPEQYVASEFIVEVSAGQTLETVTADKRHWVTCSQLDDSHYKVMTYSSANSTFNSDALVQLHISGEGMVNVHDALLVDESRKGVAFAPAVGGYTTGINQMENGKLIIENSSVYDLQGKKRDTLRPYKHEVLIVNGKKQVVR